MGVNEINCPIQITDMSVNKSKSELRWVLLWAVTIVVLASIPYIFGIAITPQGYHFAGFTHNIDDGAVYLSWMRQAADGNFFIRNLFTSQPQASAQFNILFLIMGWLTALTHLPPIIIFHAFRIGLGIALIYCIWWFSFLFLKTANERRLLIPLIGLSAGVGWLIPGAAAPSGSVDVWQPEAITFLSIYLNPLFLAGLILMLGSLYFFTLAQRTGKYKYGIFAGVCLLLLGNIHTYDVLTVATVWIAYLLLVAILERKLPTKTIAISTIAALIAIPSIAYQVYLYRIDEVFRARANSPIPSPDIWAFFAGYGLVLIGALAGIKLCIIKRRNVDDPNKLLLIVWAVIGFILPYIPIGQQRKLIMGLHIPLCILCAYALTYLLVRLKQSTARGLLLAAIIFTTGSNVLFLSRDMSLLSIGETAPHYAAFISDAEIDAMRYLRDHATLNDIILAPPSFALFVPAIAGRQVYYGHWSETPYYSSKISAWAAYIDASTLPESRNEILRESGASYVVFLHPSGGVYPKRQKVDGNLEVVFTQKSVLICRVLQASRPSN